MNIEVNIVLSSVDYECLKIALYIIPIVLGLNTTFIEFRILSTKLLTNRILFLQDNVVFLICDFRLVILLKLLFSCRWTYFNCEKIAIIYRPSRYSPMGDINYRSKYGFEVLLTVIPTSLKAA